MYIPKDFLEIEETCPECPYSKKMPKFAPDVLMGHLVEKHDYKVEEAETMIQKWMDDYTIDEDGHPIEECPDHGFYRIANGCAQCDMEDSRFQEWKENRKETNQ